MRDCGHIEQEEVDPALVLNLQKQLELRRSRVSALKSDWARFYQPHKIQEAFHAAAQYKRRFVRAGNRVGKSTMGAMEDGAWVRGERVWYGESHPLRRAGIPQRPVKGVVLAADLDIIKEIWTGPSGKLWKAIPRNLVKSTWKSSTTITTVELKNESQIHFDTVAAYLKNPLSAESKDWDFIHVDEPCPKGMWTAHARGLIDRGGSAWFTLTPLSEPWINDYFFPEWEQQEELAPKDVINGQRWATSASIYDNPHLSKEAVEEFLSGLSEEEKSCRIYGLPLHLAGLVYKEFVRAKHYEEHPLGWELPNKPPVSWPTYWWLDPHPQTPHAVLFVAVAPSGKRYYYDEIFEAVHVDELARLIKEKEKGRYIAGRTMDPLGFVKDPTFKKSLATELASRGIPVRKAVKDPLTGILRVKNSLRENQIMFTGAVRRTLWEMARYAWDQKPDRVNKPVDKDDHMMENLGRAEMFCPQWVDASAMLPVNVVEEIDQSLVGFDFAEDNLEFFSSAI